jgi:hypothetical protein
MASAGRVIAGCRETETRLAPPVTWNTLPTLATTMFARLYDARSFVTAALRSIGSVLQANTTVETVPASSSSELPMVASASIPGPLPGSPSSRLGGAPGRSRRANHVIASTPVWVVRTT